MKWSKATVSIAALFLTVAGVAGLNAGSQYVQRHEEHLVNQAAWDGNNLMLGALFWVGADPKSDRATPLANAAWQGHLDTVVQLVGAGVDVNANEGLALDYASFRGYTDIVSFLLNAGANVNARDNVALKRAALMGRTKIVELLLDYGADAQSGEPNALSKAVQGKNTVEVVTLLLSRISFSEDEITSAIEMARINNNKTAECILLSYETKQSRNLNFTHIIRV